MVRVLVFGIVVAIVVTTAVVFLAYLLILGPSITYLTINALYVFLMPTGNGRYELFYYDSNGNLHDLGTYKVQSNALNQAVSEINSFNQRSMGTIINGQLLISLSYEVIIGNATWAVQVPIQGNTVLLDSVSPIYWTVIVTDQNDLTKNSICIRRGI